MTPNNRRRPTTPENQHLQQARNNLPQVQTPHTHRRFQHHLQNPPDSPQRRRVPNPPHRPHHPFLLCARQPLDQQLDVRHMLEGAFDVE